MDDLRSAIIDYVEKVVGSDENNHLFRKPLVGFARADDPLFTEIPKIVGEHHLMPADVLPEVKTLVSIFIPFSEKVINGNRGRGPVSTQWGQAYLAANALIGRINGQLADLLEPSGIKVASVPATHTFDTKTLRAGWSHRSAAFVAGLGRFGLNRMLIGPAGGAGRYGTAFLSVELPPSPKYEEDHCLYFKTGQCRACVRDCPVEALTEKKYDRHLCYRHLLKVSADQGYADGSLDVCGKCDVAGPCALIK